MSDIVMILRGQANGMSTPFDGQYLKDMNFEAHNGRGDITMTTDVREAMRFSSHAKAFEFYRSVPRCKPIRDDLKPNRPLTATNWEFAPLEQEAS